MTGDARADEHRAESVRDREQPELPLLGGTTNRGLVVRVGDSVRRPRRPTGPATHALLRHLSDAGFDGAPRFLGTDSEDREVLTYVPGSAVTLPYPVWALTDDALVSVAELLRAYHQAVSTFDPSPYAWPSSPPAPFAGGLVSHNDVNLDNVVFREGRAAALIDFDLASPGSRVWDVACAARLWAPLRPDYAIGDERRGHALDRFRLFVDAYGLPDADRSRLVEAVLHNHEWCYDIVRSAAAHGHAGFSEYVDSGGGRRADQTYRWYLDNRDVLQATLR
jgi:hypothetical protein